MPSAEDDPPEGHDNPQGLDALAHVRKRPGMYFGSQTMAGAMYALWEVISNSLDQVVAGKASSISVTVHDDGSISVADDGEGIRTDTDDSGLSFLERAFTRLHTGPTLDGHRPRLHVSLGVGLGPVCAVSQRVEVDVRNGQGHFSQTFAWGKALGPLASERPTEGTGTCIRLHLDPAIFEDLLWDATAIQKRLVEVGSLWPGLRCSFEQQTTDLQPRSNLATLLATQVGLDPQRHPAHAPLLLERTDGALSVRVALQWCRARWPGAEKLPEVVVSSWCNFRRTEDGGSHVDGFLSGLLDVFDTTSRHLVDVGAGLVVVIDTKEIDPTFRGPTHAELDSPALRALVRSTVVQQLPLRLAEQPDLTREISERLVHE